MLVVSLAVALLICAAAVNAAPPTTPYTSALTVLGNLGTGNTISLVADVVQLQNGLYHYTYTVDYRGPSTRAMGGINIGDIPRLEWLNALNTQPNYFAVDPVWNPADVNQNSIQWNAGTYMPVNNTVVFSYDSSYSWGLVDVTLSGGGWTASGKTLGLVPEPASIAALISGLGLVGFVVRRRRK